VGESLNPSVTEVKRRRNRLLGLVKIDPRFLVSPASRHKTSRQPATAVGSQRVSGPVYGPGAPGRSAHSYGVGAKMTG